MGWEEKRKYKRAFVKLTVEYRGQSFWQGYSKAILRKMYPGDNDTKALTKEKDLLIRITFTLIPKCLLGLFYKPVISGKILYYIVYVLCTHFP